MRPTVASAGRRKLGVITLCVAALAALGTSQVPPEVTAVGWRDAELSSARPVATGHFLISLTEGPVPVYTRASLTIEPADKMPHFVGIAVVRDQDGATWTNEMVNTFTPLDCEVESLCSESFTATFTLLKAYDNGTAPFGVTWSVTVTATSLGRDSPPDAALSVMSEP